MSLEISERLCLKGIRWKGKEQDARCLPLAFVHMQECTATHVDTQVNTTHTHTDGHISKLYCRNLLQQKWINAALKRLVKEKENLRQEVGSEDIKK